MAQMGTKWNYLGFELPEFKKLLVKDLKNPDGTPTTEEQANVCLALLMGYSASFIDHGEKQEHVQQVLNRCWDILNELPGSLLKLRLLTVCYGEVFDEPLADEARKIISSWNGSSLTAEQQEAIEEFQNVVDNPYPWEEVDE